MKIHTMIHKNETNHEKFLLLVLFFAPILSGAIEPEEMDALVLDFCQTEEKYHNLDAYHP